MHRAPHAPHPLILTPDHSAAPHAPVLRRVAVAQQLRLPQDLLFGQVPHADGLGDRVRGRRERLWGEGRGRAGRRGDVVRADDWVGARAR